jgi:trehalose/maltose hydrolase-like predicted phosphorylase
VIKQADLVLAMHWQGHAFTPEQKARNVSYYEPRTVRDSSLSACTQAVLCAEVGHLQLAYDYTHEAALIDLRDLHHNTRDGLHMASLAGSWIALVAGFGGLRDDEGVLAMDPMLPEGIRRLRFRLIWHGVRLLVDVDHQRVTYTVRDGSDTRLTLRHAGKDMVVTTSQPLAVPLQRRTPSRPTPTQPLGRAPVTRSPLERD